MQHFKSDTSHTQADGAILWSRGGPAPAKVANCRLVDLAGDMRATVYITDKPDTWITDTFFFVPAACRIKGCRVKGYITSEDGNAVFRHVYY